jgi:hypothetical protein
MTLQIINTQISRISGEDYILLRAVIYLHNKETGETSARSERKVSDKTKFPEKCDLLFRVPC